MTCVCVRCARARWWVGGLAGGSWWAGGWVGGWGFSKADCVLWFDGVLVCVTCVLARLRVFAWALVCVICVFSLIVHRACLVSVIVGANHGDVVPKSSTTPRSRCKCYCVGFALGYD